TVKPVYLINIINGFLRDIFYKLGEYFVIISDFYKHINFRKLFEPLFDLSKSICDLFSTPVEFLLGYINSVKFAFNTFQIVIGSATLIIIISGIIYYYFYKYQNINLISLTYNKLTLLSKNSYIILGLLKLTLIERFIIGYFFEDLHYFKLAPLLNLLLAGYFLIKQYFPNSYLYMKL